jgi:acetyl esterase/lipase
VKVRGWVVFSLAAALLLAACGDDSSERSEPSDRETGTTTTTTRAPATTVTSVAPRTAPVPPAPPPAITVPPPAITVPPGSPGTTPATTTPATTTPPTVTAAPEPTTTTTRPGRAQRKTVVYSPPGAPKWRGDLVLPRQHGDTIVVLVHPDDKNGSRKQMRSWANFYAQHGYPSFAIDYTLTVIATYPKPQTDVKAAVQYLRGRAAALGIDPDRIVVQGFGAGAALGAQAEVTPDDPFFAGPRHYPDQSDKPAAFIGFYGLYDGTRKDPLIYYGDPADGPEVQERYAKANSIAQATNAAGPALLVQGDADSPEFVESATQFRDALQSAGKDVTLTLVPGEFSGFDQETSGTLTPEGKQAAQQVLDWLTARFPAQ